MTRFVIILLLAEWLIAYFVLAPACILRRDHVRAFAAWRERSTPTMLAELDRLKRITTSYRLGFSSVALGVMAGFTLLGVRIFRHRHPPQVPPTA